jgi:hypothetical protein
MKRTKLFAAGLLLLLAVVSFYPALTGPRPVSANSTGPPPGRTGAPGEGTCLFCHRSYPLNDPSGGVVLDGLPDSYTPGEPIEFTVTVYQDGTGGVRKDWGFELTVLDADDTFAGTLMDSDPKNTHVVSSEEGSSTRYYIEQTLTGSFFDPDGADVATWTMIWVPPDDDVGPVTFYVAGNAGNGDRTILGDYIFTNRQTVLGPDAGRAIVRER